VSSDRSLPRPWGLGVPFLGGTHQDKHRAIREFRHLHGRPKGAARVPRCDSAAAVDSISWVGRYSQKGPEEFDECRGA